MVFTETDRLVAERIGEGHQEELSVLLGDPRVGATLGGTLTPARVAAWVVSEDAHWEAHGFGYCLWREKATGAAVARGGLHCQHVGGRDEVEVGWAVAPDRWGEGLATELGAASARLAFDVVGLDDIVAYTLVGNRASRRVMDKLGFQFEREIEHAGLPHVLYRLAAAP
jgi:RimJ/RimL family protein N-acetyltransferase